MYLDKTEIEIWTNHGQYNQEKKKPKQTKIGSLIFEGFAEVKSLERVLEAIDENMFQHDPVEFRVKLRVKNSS